MQKWPFEDFGKPRWVAEGVLARSSRPAYWDDATQELVSQWLSQVLQMGVKTIICLLSNNEIQEYYATAGIDLFAAYRDGGLEVIHLPARNHQDPPLNSEQTAELLQAFSTATKPVLVHCSAGVGRTGMVVRFLQNPTLVSIHHPNLSQEEYKKQ